MSLAQTGVSVRALSSLLLPGFSALDSVLLEGLLVVLEGLDVVDPEGQEAAVGGLEGLELLGELLHAEGVVRLLLLRLEQQDLGLADVQGGRLRGVVVADVVVLREAPVGLGAQVEAPVLVSWTLSKMKEAFHIPDLVEGLLRVGIGSDWSVGWRHLF